MRAEYKNTGNEMEVELGGIIPFSEIRVGRGVVTAGLGRVRSPRGEEGGGGNLTKGVASSGTNAEPCRRVQRLKKAEKKSGTHHSHVE